LVSASVFSNTVGFLREVNADESRVVVRHVVAATTPERLARPFGCFSLLERKRSAAEFTAPHETTTMSAECVSISPLRRTTTSLMFFPPLSVTSFSTYASVSRVTFSCASAGFTPMTWASDFPSTTHGKPSAGVAAHADARLRPFLVELDPERHRKWLVPNLP